MKIIYPTIDYDSYWHQIVVGYGKLEIGVGIVFWKRLFCIGKPHLTIKI